MRARGAFEHSSKRRRGFPSETQVKHGHGWVHGDKELVEKLGRKDLCPCGSGEGFKEMLLIERSRWLGTTLLFERITRDKKAAVTAAFLPIYWFV